MKTEELMQGPPKRRRAKKKMPERLKDEAPKKATVKRLGVDKLEPKLQQFIKRHRLKHHEFKIESPNSIVVTSRHITSFEVHNH